MHLNLPLYTQHFSLQNQTVVCGAQDIGHPLESCQWPGSSKS